MGSGPAHALNQFLQAGFGVIHGPTQAPNAVKVRLKGPENKAASRIVALIQINGRDQSLKGFFKDGLSVMTSRLHLTFAQAKILAQGEAAGGAGEAGAANQGRAALGQLSLGYSGQVLVKLGGYNQLKHGIAKKLHAFVGIQGGAAMLVQVGTMDQGLSEQAPVAESRAQRGFQVFQGQLNTRLT